MSDPPFAYLTPEARDRVEIDQMLHAAGWVVQDAKAVNLSASRGVAVREFVMKPPHGRADYLLFLDGRPVGVIEAKKEGETLTGVEWQSMKYVDGVPDELVSATASGSVAPRSRSIPSISSGGKRSDSYPNVEGSIPSRPMPENRLTNGTQGVDRARRQALAPPLANAQADDRPRPTPSSAPSSSTRAR